MVQTTWWSKYFWVRFIQISKLLVQFDGNNSEAWVLSKSTIFLASKILNYKFFLLWRLITSNIFGKQAKFVHLTLFQCHCSRITTLLTKTLSLAKTCLVNNEFLLDLTRVFSFSCRFSFRIVFFSIFVHQLTRSSLWSFYKFCVIQQLRHIF